MRPTFPRFPALGGRSAFARFAALVGAVGLLLSLAQPAIGQDAPAEPSGVFGVTIGRFDLPPGLAGGPALVGQWTVTFNEDGSYEVARQDVGVLASGRFEISGRTLNVLDWSGLVGCGGTDEEPSTASYAWELLGDELRLTPIQDTCTDRRILLTTRGFGRYEACTTAPLEILGAPGAPEPPGPVTTPPAAAPGGVLGALPGATPVAGPPDGEPAGADVAAEIETLLRQATGCWATGDPARFLALHSQPALDAASALGGSLATVATQVAQFMATPVGFELIGDVTQTDPTHATAYVEISFGGEPIPQSFTFARQDGAWLIDFLFLLGPPQAAPTPQP